MRDGAVYRDDSHSTGQARAVAVGVPILPRGQVSLAAGKEEGGPMIDFTAGCVVIALVAAFYMWTRGEL